MLPARESPPGRYRQLAAAALLAATAAGLVSHGRAADGIAVDDVKLARDALAVLDADPALRDFILVVSVVDRVAVVGGPVGTTAQKTRAADLVRAVPGVREVRNGCFVQIGSEPLLKSNLSAARPLPVLPPVVIPLRPGSTAEAPPTGDLIAAAPQAEPLTGERSVVARRPANPGENILQPPVASSPAASAGVSPYPPGVLTTRPAFAESVETARRSDTRFAGLRAEFRDGGTVVITGTARRPADAWDFADLVRGVPGVTRVAVGPVGR
ncbi:BON domain-containing protein [Urbifossiella limnaea]|uniref:BON domain protein n=1 Tax=Urbifossiella limnaea TaxID=2528023 RepID=A0A517XRV1_9BACT|nr:BON domain-containing protein [Urbifossiella limnaea]QDU20241.1 BON domain protein [Urbifossiella limnaea]